MTAYQGQLCVNNSRCTAIAAILAQTPIPASQEEFTLADLPADLAANLILCAVAICHQTQELRGYAGGYALRGWDYLCTKLIEACRRQQFLMQPEFWINVTPANLEEVFVCDTQGRTLTDPVGRAALVADLGTVMLLNGWTSLLDVCVEAKSKEDCRANKLIANLQKFRAFQDPVQKKSLYLIALLKSCCGWTFCDEAQLAAPVDYHEVRGHMRIGTIEVLSRSLLEKINKKLEITETEDIAIRSAVRDAIFQIASAHGGASQSALHYLFWNLFRNVCTRETPQCELVMNGSSLPARYEYLIHLNAETSSCPFSRACSAHSARVYPIEPHSPRTIWY